MKRTNLLKFLEDFLGNKLYVPGPEGGPGDEKDDERQQFLLHELKNIIANNNNWLKVIYGVLILFIVFLSTILWYKQNDSAFFFAILGGQGASIVFCINRLGYFYKQKRSSEILLYLYSAATTKKEKDKILNEIIAFLKNR